MKPNKTETYIDFTMKDASGKKLDEGFMSISQCIKYWKGIMKKKCR